MVSLSFSPYKLDGHRGRMQVNQENKPASNEAALEAARIVIEFDYNCQPKKNVGQVSFFGFGPGRRSRARYSLTA